MKIKFLGICFFLLFTQLVFSQNKLRVYGYVIDTDNRGIELANVYVEESKVGTSTNQNGYYDLNIEIKDSVTLVYSRIGYKSIKFKIGTQPRVLQISVELTQLNNEIGVINVTGQRKQTNSMDALDATKYRLMPNANGSIESLLITFAGVSSNNELSSQYNVRGGNFDENIVYVNGIEVYRPLLVRAGQQEGLSFINPDMVKSISFSSGGFDAKYGDKSASVLDVNYKQPDTFEATAAVSLLGAAAFVGTANSKFTQMHGIRYKTNSYLLGTLDTKGEYNPAFIDYQTFLTYKLQPKWELTFLGNFSQNTYQFIPRDRETSFGTYNMGRNLMVFFEGQEKDLFRTGFGALSINYTPNVNTKLSLQTSVFNTNESENYDILGEYLLSEVKMDLKEENKKGETLGIGKYHEHARNTLNATVATVGHVGEYAFGNNKLRWGAHIQAELIKDKISEWEWRDSAGYSLPNVNQELNLYYNLKTANQLNTFRTTAYLQNTYRWESNTGAYTVTGGIRANYWTFNNELLLSPRVSFSYLPEWKRDFAFRFATGVYYQAPFYKEIRDTVSDALGNVNISLNSNIKAQRNLHLVLGGDYYFRAWGRPFKFTTEAYAKLADRVISYSVDNVRIRYSGKNDAKAYTTGVDFKLFGELVPGTDSWINFSLMDSKEDILDDLFEKNIYDENQKVIGTTTYSQGWVPRPSEQRYAFSMLFKDYFPNNPKYELLLKLIYSDGLPFGPPRNLEYRTQYRMPPYRRVDVGVSRVLVNGVGKELSKDWLKHVAKIWFNVELFNLLGFKNVNSYYWVTDIYNQQLAVPNYLTGRQINLKIMVDFK